MLLCLELGCLATRPMRHARPAPSPHTPSPRVLARRALNVISFQVVLHTGISLASLAAIAAIASALASLEHTGSQKKFENEICRHFLHRKAAAEAGFVRASSSNWTPQPRQRRVALDAGATA